MALKVLPTGPGCSPDLVARFEREMKAIGRLDHPNLVRAYDAGETVDRRFLFLAMELLEGIDARDLSKTTVGCRSTRRVTSSGKPRRAWRTFMPRDRSTATSSRPI